MKFSERIKKVLHEAQESADATHRQIRKELIFAEGDSEQSRFIGKFKNEQALKRAQKTPAQRRWAGRKRTERIRRFVDKRMTARETKKENVRATRAQVERETETALERAHKKMNEPIQKHLDEAVGEHRQSMRTRNYGIRQQAMNAAARGEMKVEAKKMASQTGYEPAVKKFGKSFNRLGDTKLKPNYVEEIGRDTLAQEIKNSRSYWGGSERVPALGRRIKPVLKKLSGKMAGGAALNAMVMPTDPEDVKAMGRSVRDIPKTARKIAGRVDQAVGNVVNKTLDKATGQQRKYR